MELSMTLRGLLYFERIRNERERMMCVCVCVRERERERECVLKTFQSFQECLLFKFLWPFDYAGNLTIFLWVMLLPFANLISFR
jgi:hypothetical protein